MPADRRAPIRVARWAAAVALAVVLGAAVVIAERLQMEFVVLGVAALLLCAAVISRAPVWAVLLPLLYVDNPIVRYLGISNSSPFGYGPTAALLLLGLIVAIGAVAVEGRRPRFRELDALIGVVMAVTVVSAAYGYVRGNPPEYVFSDVAQYLEFGIFYAIARVLIEGRTQALYVVGLIAIVATLAAATDLLQLVTGRISLGPLGTAASRPDQLINPLAALQIPALLTYLIHNPRRHRFWIMGALTICTASMLLGFTRGLWLGVAGAVIFLTLTLDRAGLRFRPIVLTLGGVAGTLALASLPALLSDGAPDVLGLALSRAQYTSQQLLDPVNEIQMRRIIEVDTVVQSLPTVPILGLGLGATYVGPTGASLADLVIGPRHYIHDAYAALLFRMGVLGLLCTAWLSIRYLWLSVRAYRRETDTVVRAILLGLPASYVATAIFSVTTDSLFRDPIGMFTGLALALTVSLARQPGTHGEEGEAQAVTPTAAPPTRTLARHPFHQETRRGSQT
ncbi:MAG: hypothetical protein M3082_06325 [Candidatus Dormibacteraeota bacterium]|nr:hypothetical protein [Candidatus Dormibacteraeota bacterium]